MAEANERGVVANQAKAFYSSAVTTARHERMAAVLFTDLVGSTELLSRVGEAAFDTLRRQHFALLRFAIRQAGGEELKTTGDGILAVFASAANALACAVAMQQGVDRQARAGQVALVIRIGLALGDVVFEEGDVFGVPVVEAARLVAAAQGGQILATAVVRAVAGARSDADFADIGSLDLKGLPEPVAACQVTWEPLATSAVPLPAAFRRRGRIFVGRDEEMDHLQKCWTQATVDELRCVLLAGEPGVGKTRLAAELAAQVQAEGASVLAGRCDEGLGVPYQPFVEAIRYFVDHTAVDELRHRLGRYGGELTRLVPEVSALLPSLAPTIRSDPETERFRLFDAVAAWLMATSAEEPVLLVLDDLQWAAKPTLLLLRHVLRSSEPMRLLILATYRDTEVGRAHPLSELLADLRQLECVKRVSLSGLDLPAVTAFLEQAAGHDLGPERTAVTHAIHRETEGNAFFVREVVRHLIETGDVRQRDGRWVAGRPVEDFGIPESIREVVGRRVSRLSKSANHALAVAAVIGQEFELGVLQACESTDEEAILAALDEAVAARLVVEAEGPVPRYRFSHSLVRATLYEELTSPRRALLHRAVATAMETAHERRIDDHLPALAHHYARAATPRADTTKAVEYAARAGNRALALLAHDEAVDYFRQALDLVDAAGAPTPRERRTDLLILLGEAQRRSGDPAHRETLLTAARLAEEQGDADALAKAALANNRGFFSKILAVDGERVRVLEAAVAASSPADSLTRARLLANLAGELTFVPDHERRHRLAEEALAMARRLGDAATLGHVLSQRFAVLPSSAKELREYIAELSAVAARLDDPALDLSIAVFSSAAALSLGDLPAYNRSLDDVSRLADEVGQPPMQFWIRLTRAYQCRITGQLAAAETLALEAFDRARAIGMLDAFRIYGGLLFWIRYDQGRLDTVVDLLERAASKEQRDVSALAALCVALCELGRYDEARVTFIELAADNFVYSPNFLWLYTITLASQACAALDDVERAALLRERLAPFQDLVVTAGVHAFGAVSHYLGLLDATLGRLDEADTHFAAAAAMHDRMNAPTLLARTRLEWGQMLLRRGVGDAHRARILLGQAIATARELGLCTVERRATSLLGDPAVQ